MVERSLAGCRRASTLPFCRTPPDPGPGERRCRSAEGAGEGVQSLRRGRRPMHRTTGEREYAVHADPLEKRNAAAPGGGSAHHRSMRYFKMLTARAMTRPTTARQAVACTAMASLAHRASGMTSVGLKAMALVKARYR
jgi:hypothetical protein